MVPAGVAAFCKLQAQMKERRRMETNLIEYFFIGDHPFIIIRQLYSN
jgi:hypothetical protein